MRCRAFTVTCYCLAIHGLVGALSAEFGGDTIEDAHTITRRIMGGKMTPIAVPYMVAIRRPGQERSTRSSGHPYCGGTLIAEDWVLTAGHCVQDKAAREPGNEAWVGGLNINNPDEYQIRDIVQWECHPGFVFNSFDGVDNDICVLRLNASVSLQTVVLNDEQTNEAAMEDTLVMGYGRLEANGDVTETLHQVQLPLQPQSICEFTYNQVRDSFKSTQMICAGDVEGGKDSCFRDSGSPLFHDVNQIGVVSWGDGCGRPNKFGVYTKVSHYVSWIQTTINKPVKLSSLDGRLSSYGQPAQPDNGVTPPAVDSGSEQEDSVEEGEVDDIYTSDDIEEVIEVLGASDVPIVVATFAVGLEESAAISDLSSEEESAILEEVFGNATSGNGDGEGNPDAEQGPKDQSDAHSNSNSDGKPGSDGHKNKERDKDKDKTTHEVLAPEEDRNVIAIGVIEPPDWCGDGCLISKSSVPEVISPGIYPLTSLGVKINHTAYVGFTGPLGTGLILSRQPDGVDEVARLGPITNEHREMEYSGCTPLDILYTSLIVTGPTGPLSIYSSAGDACPMGAEERTSNRFGGTQGHNSPQVDF